MDFQGRSGPRCAKLGLFCLLRAKCEKMLDAINDQTRVKEGAVVYIVVE